MLPTSFSRPRATRDVARRVATTAAAFASVFLLATCDLDKITATKSPDGTGGPSLSFSIAGGDQVLLAGTTPLSVSPSLGGQVAIRWSSSAPAIAAVDSITGVVSGIAIGTATISAQVLAMELDSGFTQTKSLDVRYKGIRIAPVDSIEGLGLTRGITVRGLNAADEVQPTVLSGATLTVHDSGSTGQTIASVSGTIVKGLKSGVAFVKATFEGDLTDSVKVRIRPVAGNIQFQGAEFTATALNTGFTVPLTVLDVADSVIVAPTLRWRSTDTTIVAIDSVTGVLRVKVLDTARVFARMDTVERGLLVQLVQAPSAVTTIAGADQTVEVLQPVPTPPRVRVTDAGDAPIAGIEVTFRSGSGAGAVLTDSVVATDANGEAQPGSWTLGPVAGAYSLVASVGTQSTEIAAEGVPGPAHKLEFRQQPSPTARTSVMTPAIFVGITDSVGNLVQGAADSVFLAFANNPSGATLGGTVRAQAVNGVATFNDLSVDASGAAFTLSATSPSLTGAVSDAFDIFDSATQMVFIDQPQSNSLGATMQPVRVAVRDAFGVTVTTSSHVVTLGISNDASGGFGALTGTVSRQVVNGIATFDDLKLSPSATGYTLAASTDGIPSAISAPFDVTPVGPATQLVFTTQPVGGVAGDDLPLFRVEVRDANGGLVTSSAQEITVAIGDNPGGGTPSGTLAVNAVAGVAEFTGVAINKAGTGYTLVASATGSALTEATSAPFDVTPSAPAQLGFVQQPTHVPAGTTMVPPVVVAVQDEFGNTVSDAEVTQISLTMNISACNGTLGGGGPVASASGLATFDAVSISAQSTGCALRAQASGLTDAFSRQFNVTAADGPVALGFTQQPTNSSAGSAIPAFTVSIQNAAGSTVTNPASVDITITVIEGPAQPVFSTLTQSTQTSATFSSVRLDSVGTYRLLATAPGFRPDTSDAFTVNAGAAARVGWILQPLDITAGVPFSPRPRVAVQDQFGNTITNAGNTINFNAFIQGGGGSVRFPGGNFQLQVNATNGVAELPVSTIYEARGNILLFASSSGLFGSNSDPFSVAIGPLAKLGFVSQPPSPSVQAGNIFSVSVQGQDSVGNLITTFASDVTLSLIGGAPEATLNGTVTLSPTGGVANFGDLSVTRAGDDYQLSASASGVPTATSTAFDVTTGPASLLHWVHHPQATFVNAPLDPAGTLVQVAVQDEWGNTLDRDFGIVRITVNAGPAANFRNRTGNFLQTQIDLQFTDGIASLPAEWAMEQVGTYSLMAATPFEATTSAASSDFTVSAFDAKTKLVFIAQPSNPQFRARITPDISVGVYDQWNNLVTDATDAITLSLAVDANPVTTLTGTDATAVNGVAFFDNVVLDRSGVGYHLLASASGLESGTSIAFTANPAPGVLASGRNNVRGLVRVGDWLYFTEQVSGTGTLNRVSVTGGAVDTLASNLNAPKTVVTDGTNLYWIETASGAENGGAIKRLPLGGGTPETVSSGFTVDTEDYLQLHNGSLLFVARSEQSPTTMTAIRQVNAIATGGLASDVAWHNAIVPIAFTIDPTDGRILIYDQVGERIYAITGNDFTTIGDVATGVGNWNCNCVAPMTVIGTDLYFSNGSTVSSVPVTGGTPTPRITGLSSALGLTSDATNLYLTASDGNTMTIRRHPLSDITTGTTVGEGNVAGTLPVFDALSIYWPYFSAIAKATK